MFDETKGAEKKFVFVPPFGFICDDDVCAQWCFRVVNESGQVALLLSVIAIGREIGREVQVREKEMRLANPPWWEHVYHGPRSIF